MEEILGTYEFHFVNRNIKQVRNVISHETYLNAYTSLKEADFKKFMKKYGEWVTTNSPYYKAIETGIYEVALCGKIYLFEVNVKKINEIVIISEE